MSPDQQDQKRVRVAVVRGDGIGPEVIAEAIKVLEAAMATTGAQLELSEYELGADRFLKTGQTITDAELSAVKMSDAILLGAVGGVPGDPRLAHAEIERSLLLRLRFELDQYVNLRPSTRYGSTPADSEHPEKVDLVIVREGTEGAYVGNGGAIRRGTPHEVANETSVNTAYGVERVVRYAFDLARLRRKRLTLVHKTNVLVFAGALWNRTFATLAEEYSDVDTDYLHVDAAAMRLVTSPHDFDVVVTDNLFGDILTDLAAAVTGGIGLAASANVNPDRTFPSMFEPVHGSAPDIAGLQIADPTAAILSVSMMLDHLGFEVASSMVRSAAEADIASRSETARATSQIGDDILARLTGMSG